MNKAKTKSKILIFLFVAVFTVSPIISGRSLAAATTLSIVTTRDNVPMATIPAITFTGGDDVSDNGTIPDITFTGGGSGNLVTLPDIIFAGGDDVTAASVTITVPSGMADNATDHVLEIDGVTVDLGTVIKPDIQIAADIANADFSAKDYTVVRPGGTSDLVFTRKNVGADGNGQLTVQNPDYSSSNVAAAVASITIADPLYGGDPYDHSVTIDGLVIDLGSSAQTQSEIAQTIAAAITADGTKDYSAVAAGSALTLTKNVAGEAGNVSLTIEDAKYSRPAAAASATINIPAGMSGDTADHTVTIDGVTIDLGTSDLDDTEVADAISAGLTGDAGYGAKDYTVSSLGGSLIFTQKVAGLAGNNITLTRSDPDYGAVAQIVTITFSNITPGETITLTINGMHYAYTIKAGDDAAAVVGGLKAAITSPDVTATGTNTLILTANTPGTAFTVTDGLGGTAMKTKRYRVSGYIKNQGTLLPINGASVKIYTRGGKKKDSVKTDNDGRYKLKKLKKGKYVVKISAPGYLSPGGSKNISFDLEIKSSKHRNFYLANPVAPSIPIILASPNNIPSQTAQPENASLDANITTDNSSANSDALPANNDAPPTEQPTSPSKPDHVWWKPWTWF